MIFCNYAKCNANRGPVKEMFKLMALKTQFHNKNYYGLQSNVTSKKLDLAAGLIIVSQMLSDLGKTQIIPDSSKSLFDHLMRKELSLATNSG